MPPAVAGLERRAVAREVNEAHRTMERHGWRSVDASYLAIEEIAREVMQLVYTSEEYPVE